MYILVLNSIILTENVEERMQFEYLYELLFHSKDTMPKFYYNTPEQEKLQNIFSKNNLCDLNQKINKQIQTDNDYQNYLVSVQNDSDNDQIKKDQLFQLIQTQDISEIHALSSFKNKTLEPFGFFCLPTVSIYVRDCCFQVLCAKFERIKSFHNSILMIPYQANIPDYIKLLLKNDKSKIIQACLKDKFTNLQQGQLLYIRSDHQNYQILTFYKLTRFINSSFEKGLKRMLYKGKQIDAGKHRSLTILYQSRFDPYHKVTQMVMAYLQTIKNPFYHKITLLCNCFDDFIKISDLFRHLIVKFHSKKELSI